MNYLQKTEQQEELKKIRNKIDNMILNAIGEASTDFEGALSADMSSQRFDKELKRIWKLKSISYELDELLKIEG